MRLKYWSDLCENLRAAHSSLQPNSEGARTWLGLKRPVKNFSFGLYTASDHISVYIGFSGEEAVRLIEQLRDKHKSQFEEEVGGKVEWPGAMNESTRFYLSVWSDADPSDSSDWPSQHQWLKETGEKVARAFPKYVELVSKRK